MQEFNYSNFNELLLQYETNLIRITNILNNNIKLDKNLIEELTNLYNEKKLIIEDISVFLKSPEGKEITDNNQTINKKLLELQKLEKSNLNLIETQKSDIKNKLKQINKNKSLLIYSKR